MARLISLKRLVGVATLISAFAVAGCHSSARAPAKSESVAALTDEQKKLNVESFDVVWTTVRDKHFDPTLHGVDWNAVRDELRPKVEVANYQGEARAFMSEALERLGESHFGIIPSDVYASMDSSAAASAAPKPSPATVPTAGSASAPSTGPSDSVPSTVAEGATKPAHGYAGFRVQLIKGQVVVAAVDHGSAADDAAVKSGWILVEANGKKTDDVLKKIKTAYGDSPEFEIYAQAGLRRLTAGTVGDVMKLVFLDGTDRKVVTTLSLGELPGVNASFGNVPEQRVIVESRRLDSNVGYVSLNIFFDPPTVMPKFGSAVQASMDADGMIIDLRGNPGGIGAMAMGMGNWFIGNQYLGTMITRGGPMKFALTPRPVQFKKPLAILVDGGSASTSEILAGGLQDLGRARIFGTRTAGAALPSTIERLPNGDGFQYAFADYVTRSGRHLEGAGVIPDEKVVLDRKSLLAGKDPVIEAAVKWIKSSKTN